MPKPRAALFDLDDTLAESFQPPAQRVIDLLSALLEKMPVAIITAAGWQRIENQFLTPLSKSPFIDRFYVFANSSAQCYIHEDGLWKETYNLSLSEDEHARVVQAIQEAAIETDIVDPRFTPEIIDRGPQIAYAAIGLAATLEEKKSWDPDQSKRNRLKSAIEARVPDVEIRIGGMTTIDITKMGVNKSYGVRWFADRLQIPPEDMLYVGDALYPGGNDAVVIPTGIQTLSTSGPAETITILESLVG